MEDGADGAAAAAGGATAEERQAARKRERRWERTNFVKKVRSSDGGTIYKTELVPELTELHSWSTTEWAVAVASAASSPRSSS